MRVAKRARGIGVAAPEAADVVAVAVVPFLPAGRKLPKLIAARAHVPGLGDHDESATAAGPARWPPAAAHWHRSPQSVRPMTGARSKRKPSMPVRVTQLRIASMASCITGALVERQRVAAAGVIDQLAIGVAVVERIVEAAQRQGGADPDRSRRYG